jgi:hypothetical protein
MAATDGVRTGIGCKMYRNTGSYGTPTWTEIGHVRDVSAGAPWDLVDASIRAARVKVYAATQVDFAISAVVRKNDADAGYQALRAAADEGTALDLLVLDGAVTNEGARGFRAHFIPSLTGQDQAIGAVVYDTFDLKPSYSVDGNPKYAVVGASSSVTFSDPG